MVGDERRAIEPLAAGGVVRPGLKAGAVAADHRDHVRDRVALHGAPPGQGGVQRRVVRFRADRGRIEQRLGAHQRHRPRRLGKPLVPADSDAHPPEPRVPDAEAGVAGAEVVFLLVAWPIGDVALAIDAQQRAVGVGHHQAVEIVRPFALEDRDRQHDAKFARQRRQRLDARMLAPRMRFGEPALLLGDAEIGPLEQLGRQDHLRAQRRGLADQRLGPGDIGRQIVAVGRLERGQGQGARHQAGSCWVMQWNEPPPVNSALDGRPSTVRSGNSRLSASSARPPARASP